MNIVIVALKFFPDTIQLFKVDYGKFWCKKFLVNHMDKSYWQEKLWRIYGRIIKYAKYSFALSVNIEEENLDE